MSSKPNFSKIEIPVDFLVLHYTACNLEKTLSIFESEDRKVSGNLNKYSEIQYESLCHLVTHLQNRFQNFKKSEDIVGHEHIACRQGKADPDVLFVWTRFLNSVGLRPTKLHSFFSCDEKDLKWLAENSGTND